MPHEKPWCPPSHVKKHKFHTEILDNLSIEARQAHVGAPLSEYRVTRNRDLVDFPVSKKKPSGKSPWEITMEIRTVNHHKSFFLLMASTNVLNSKRLKMIGKWSTKVLMLLKLARTDCRFKSRELRCCQNCEITCKKKDEISCKSGNANPQRLGWYWYFYRSILDQ